MEKNNNETYSLKLITNWLQDKGLQYTFRSANGAALGYYEHGIRVKFNTYELSIQTHPDIAGWAFAETMRSTNLISETKHATPQELFDYLDRLIKEDRMNFMFMNR